MRTISAKLF